MAYAQINLEKASATIRNISLNKSRGGFGINLDGSRAVVESCAIKENANRGFNIINASDIEIRDCSVRENMTAGRVDSQIYVEKSSAVISKCSISDVKGNAVIISNGSVAEVSDCSIKNNMGNAVAAFKMSKLKVRDCKISGNGSNKKLYAQVFLDNSSADVADCEITDCVGGPGIALFKGSEISVSSCVICRNGDNGITAVKAPRVEIRDCKMMWNGTVGNCYAHIYLEAAKAVIERCRLYESHYGYAVYIYGKKRMLREDSSCDVIMNDCVLDKNRLGLKVDRLCRLRMTGCSVSGNIEGDTLYETGSIVEIDGKDIG
jgi:ribosomal protein L18